MQYTKISSKSAASFMRILILTSSWGNGHLSAAKHTQNYINSKFGARVGVEIVDIFEFCSQFMNKTLKKSYFTSLKFAPQIYKILFRGTNKDWQVKLINMLSYPFIIKKIHQLLKEKKPHLIISTYPIWNYTIRKIWNEITENSKFITIITDSTNVHQSWIHEDYSDAYIVTDKDTKDSIINMGIASEKLFDFGFPLGAQFHQNYNRQDILKASGLQDEVFTLLFILHNHFTDKEIRIIKKLAEKKNPFCQIVAVCGRNEKFIKKLEKIKWQTDKKIIGWTDEIARFMSISDLIVTKAGGATTAECLHLGKPMFVSHIIPGQEEGNANFIKKNHTGVVGNQLSVSESCALIEKFAAGDPLYAKMLAHCQTFKNNNQGYRIVDVISKFLHQGAGK